MNLNTKKGKKRMNLLYGLGASVVILGALFKIQHWEGADYMLIAGLGTEAIIFAVSAFEAPSKEYDWSLVYPQLAGMTGAKSPAKELDNMLEKAKVDSKLIQSLGEGLRKVGTAADGLGEAVKIAESTNKYSSQVNNATKNLEAINALYETQINSSTAQTNATKKLAESMEASMKNSVDMQKELESLTKNLTSLNSVYGNMLSAMSFNKQ